MRVFARPAIAELSQFREFWLNMSDTQVLRSNVCEVLSAAKYVTSMSMSMGAAVLWRKSQDKSFPFKIVPIPSLVSSVNNINSLPT